MDTIKWVSKYVLFFLPTLQVWLSDPKTAQGRIWWKATCSVLLQQIFIGFEIRRPIFGNMEPSSGPKQPKSPQFMSSALKEVNPVLNKSYHTRNTGDNVEAYTFHTFLAQPQGPPECVLFLLSYLLPFDSLFLKRKQKFIFLKPQEVLEPRAV